MGQLSTPPPKQGLPPGPGRITDFTVSELRLDLSEQLIPASVRLIDSYLLRRHRIALNRVLVHDSPRLLTATHPWPPRVKQHRGKATKSPPAQHLLQPDAVDPCRVSGAALLADQPRMA